MKTRMNRKAVDLLMGQMEKATHKRALAKSQDQPHHPDERVARFALSYLDAFGYLTQELAQWTDISGPDIIAAIKAFQGFFGLPKNGEMCVKTVRAMEMLRCRCPDIVRPWHTAQREMQMVADTALPRWQKTGITYRIRDYLPGISKSDFESAVFQAFQNWTRYGNIDVRPAAANDLTPDIIISTGQGPQSNFDGPGGVLAWAYLPSGTADTQLLMEFDLAETWTIDAAARGTLVANVACHEFGHLLGLSHSVIQGALMAPYYNASIAVPQLKDDVTRFQVRYGVRAQDPTPEEPPIVVTPIDDPNDPTDAETPNVVIGIVSGGAKVAIKLDGQKVA